MWHLDSEETLEELSNYMCGDFKMAYVGRTMDKDRDICGVRKTSA